MVAFVDDNRALRGRRIQGVPVAGPTAEIASVLASARPAEVLVAIPDAPQERLDLVLRACEAAAVPCRFVHRHTETMTPAADVVAE